MQILKYNYRKVHYKNVCSTKIRNLSDEKFGEIRRNSDVCVKTIVRKTPNSSYLFQFIEKFGKIWKKIGDFRRKICTRVGSFSTFIGYHFSGHCCKLCCWVMFCCQDQEVEQLYFFIAANLEVKNIPDE